jgi:DedD protein
MSRQQIRSSGDGAIDPSLVQKKRARHRLVGAICLCLIAAVIVPMVFESEPRPKDRDLPIELAGPDRGADERHAATPPSAGAAAADPAAAQSTVKTVVPPVAAPAAPHRVEPSRADVLRADAAKSDAAKSDAGRSDTAKADAGKPEAKAESKADAAKADVAKGDAAKADAARQLAAKQDAARHEPAKVAAGKSESAKPAPTPEKPAGQADEPDVLARLIDRSGTGGASGAGAAVTRKFLVQVGAYSNVQSARTVSDRVVQVGLRPYQETVKTAQGDWIRVRVGPFGSREEAERAQQDLKRAGVTAAIIAL